jgi:exodeoxyribonuclease VII large subunit
LAVLQRGFSLAQTKDGKLLSDAKQVSVGDSIKVRLAKGTLGARVESIDEK